MWVRMKVDHESWVNVSASALGREESEEERNTLKERLSECFGRFDIRDRF